MTAPVRRATPKQRTRKALAIAQIEWQAAERNARMANAAAWKARRTVILKRQHLDMVLDDAKQAGAV